jgi:hypothetical protein
MRLLVQPIGVDRWGQELALKYGMREGLTCPVGGRWLVAFWSPKELSNLLTQPIRIIVCAAASFAVLRLEQLLGPDVEIRYCRSCRHSPQLKLIDSPSDTRADWP